MADKNISIPPACFRMKDSIRGLLRNDPIWIQDDGSGNSITESGRVLRPVLDRDVTGADRDEERNAQS